jgi:hypothetical protein
VVTVLASRFDCWMILGHHAFNPDEKLYSSISGRIVTIDEMNALNESHNTNDMIFAFQGKLRKLRLKDEERCILAAMCVVCSGMLRKMNS